MSTSYDATGVIHSISETKEYGSNGFQKRAFAILVTGEGENEKYPNYIELELIKDKCALLDAMQVGNEVKATFNLSGRLHNSNGEERCYVNLQAWQLELLNVGAQQAPPPHDEYAQLAPGTGGAPQPQNYDAMIAEYWGANEATRNMMWDGMDQSARDALLASQK